MAQYGEGQDAFYFPKEEVETLIGRRQALPRLASTRPLGLVKTTSPFDGWLADRQMEGDRIFIQDAGLEIVDGEPHTVAWLEQTELDAEREVYVSNYFLVCECIASLNTSDDPEAMFACSGLRNALKRRAHDINQSYGITSVMGSPVTLLDKKEAYDLWRQDSEGYFLNEVGQEFAVKSLVYLLERCARNPEQWLANFRGGRLHISTLALTLQLYPVEVETFVNKLVEAAVAVRRQDEVALHPVHLHND